MKFKINVKKPKSLKRVALIIGIVVLGLIIIYNLIPYVLYLIKEYLLPKRKRGKQIDPKSPTNPWVRNITNIRQKKYLVDECSTVSQLFKKTTEKFRDNHCFGSRQLLSEEDERQSDGKVFKKVILSEYKWFTFKEIDERVDIISKGFLHIGIKPKDIVMIFAETRVEWMISCQSLFRIGSTVATLYATLGEDAIVYAINQTEVTHLITSYELLNKLKPILNNLSKLECIVYMSGYKDNKIDVKFDSKEKQISVFSINQIQELGKSNSELKGMEPTEDDIAIVMYTSGSTGIPKGVMISHKNFLSSVRSFYIFVDYLTEKDIYCAYLPLAHIMEMSAELFFLSNGLTVGFASIQTLTDKSTAIKKGIRGDAPLLRPTIMTAVPLILDRIKIAITEQLAKRGFVAKLLIKVFYKLKIFWLKRGFNTPIINFMFCRKFRAILGGRVKIIPLGGAPLSPDTHDFIRGFFNIHLMQGYGLTETSASATLMDVEDDISVGFVGPPLEGVQIKLVDWDEGNYRTTDKPNPRGEVVIGGDNVTKGYYKNEEMTKESFKEENGINWFYSGDIGEIYSNGSLKIIDRKKDIIKLSTGEYISLAKIEEELKKNKFVSNICIYGMSSMDYLIALIVPNPKKLETLAQKLSKNKMDLKELCNDSDINKKVLDSIKETAQSSKLLKTEIPTKIKLCSEEWLPTNELVTTTMKLKRKNIQEFYQKDINQMYGKQQNS